MRRQGWRFAGIACGQRLEEAEQRHFEGRSLDAPSAPNQPAPGQPASGHEYPGPWSSAPGGSGGTPGVLGVFPEPHGTKS